MLKNFNNPRTIDLPTDHQELFEKLRPTDGTSLLQKPLLEDISKKAYIYLDEKEPTDKYDNLFLENKYRFNIVRCYGYHSTGYALFFKPDLGEVIKIAQEEIRNAKICFVTTEQCDKYGYPDDNVSLCFDTKLYMHMAVTTLWYV